MTKPKNLKDLELVGGGRDYLCSCEEQIISLIKERIKELEKASKCNSDSKDNWPEANNCPNWFDCEDSFYSTCLCHRINKARISELKRLLGSD